MRDLRRRLLWAMVCSLLAAALAVMGSGCWTSSLGDHIAVKGVDGSGNGGFVYSISCRGVWTNTFESVFRTQVGKNTFFERLRGEYRVFDEDADSIHLIHSGQIYTVRSYPDGNYALFGEMVFFFDLQDSDGHLLRFPFPTDKVSGGSENSPIPRVSGSGFSTSADLPYLLRFYAVYGNAVKVEGNRITYAGITITVQDGGLVEVAGPPSTTTTAPPTP